MRNRLLITAVMLMGLRALGQGTVNFSNLSVPNSFVYDGRLFPVVRAPVGTTFSVALYWAPVDPLNPTVQPVASAFTQQGPSGHILPLPGDYSVGTVTTPTITPPGGMAWFQVKAWETACGSTYEQAYGMPGAPTGVSGVIEIPTGDPSTGGSPAVLVGIGPIFVGGGVGTGTIDPCVPEPSTVLLGFLGALVLLGLNRHKRSA